MEEQQSIKVFDKDGKEYLIPRDSYRSDVLPGIFENAWNDPDALYSAIVVTLRDEFYVESLKPTLRYQEITNDAESSSVLLGIVYMKQGRLSDARKTLESYLKEYGDSGVILTNLAKVIADEGHSEESKEVLWKALVVDPNQDNALDWWGAIHYEEGGESSRVDSFEKVAKQPGSWRAQLWLARNYLEQGEKDAALDLYRRTLSSGAESRGDALMMITGDLGNNGYVHEAITLIAPKYDPRKHGIEPGANLVMAYKQVGMKKEGTALLRKLEQLERYDWNDYLERLKNELSEI